jgi:hypothetical protein
MITSHNKHICGWVDESGAYNFSPVTFLQFPGAGVETQLTAFKLRFTAWQSILTKKRPNEESAALVAGTSPQKKIRRVGVPSDLQAWKSAWRIIGPLIAPSQTEEDVGGDEEVSCRTAISTLKTYLTNFLSSSHKTSSASDSAASDISRSDEGGGQALLLSLFGWDGRSDGSAHCSLCNRRFPMVVDPPSQDSSGSGVNGGGKTPCDVVKEHRYFCPWVSPYVAYPSLDDKEATIATSESKTEVDAPSMN